MKLIVAGIAGLLAVLLLAMLHTQPARERVLGLTQEYLEAQQNIELRASTIDYNLLTLTVWLTDVSLRAKAPGPAPPFLTAESVAVNFDISRLPFGALTVQDATVSGLQLQVIQGPGDEGNLPSTPETAQPDESESGLQFIVEKLSVPGASFRFEDRESQTRLELPGWTLRVEGDRTTLAHQVNFETENTGSLAIADARTLINHILIAVKADPAAAIVEEAVLETASSRVALSGTIENWDALNLDLRAQSHIDLEEAGRLADLDSPPSGALDADVKMSGAAESPIVEASINGSSLGWRSLREFSLATDVIWEGDSEQLAVSKLELQSTAGSLTAEGLLSLGDQGGESRVVGNLRSINLAVVSREADLPIEIASRLSGAVKANWDGLEWKRATGSLSGSLTSTLEAPVENRLPVSGRFEASGSAGDLNFTIHELRVLGSLLSGSVALADFERLGGELRAKLDTTALNTGLAALLGGERDWPATAGAAELTLSLGGTTDAPTATAELAADDLQVGQLDGVALALQSHYAPESLTMDALSLTWRGQQLAGNGSVGLTADNRSLAFEVFVSGGRIEPVLTALEIDVPASGAFTANIGIGGTLDAPVGSLSMRSEGLSVYGEGLGQLAATASYEAGAASLESLRLTTPKGGTLEANGNFNPEGNSYAVGLRADSLDFDTLTLPGDTPVRALLSFTATGAGTLDSPHLEADLSAEDVAIGPRRFGRLSLQASLDGQTGEAQWQVPDLSLRGTAKTRLSAPYNTDFSIETQDTKLAALAIPGPDGDPINGFLTASINGTAPLTDVLAGRITAAIEQLRLEADGHELHNTAPVEARLENRTIYVDSLALASGESSLTATGSLPLESATPGAALRFDSDLKITDVLAFVSPPEDLTAEGRLQLTGTVAGSLRQPLPQLKLDLAGGTLNHSSLREPLTGINANLSYEGGIARLDKLQASLGNASLEASGEAPVSQAESSAPARLEARLKGLSLQSFAAVPERVTGEISVRLSGETPALADLRQLRAEAVFEDLRLGAEGLTLQQAGSSRIQVREGVALIESLKLEGPQVRLQAAGEAGLLEDGTMDVALTGSIDSGLLAPFAKGVQADGTVRVDLAAKGPTLAPEVAGYLELLKGNFSYPEYDLTAENLNVRLDLTKDAANINRFTGMLNGGPMSASGVIPLSGDNMDDLRIGLVLRNGFFNIPDGLKTQLWATLALEPRGDEYVVGGIVKILDGSYREPLEIEGQLAGFLGSSDFEAPAERNPLLEKLNFDITLETQNPMAVDNNLMELSLESDLRITGNYYQPGMTGRLTIQEGGELFLNERRYFVERGVVSFVNERSIQPDLDVLARTRVSNYDITLRLAGGAEDYAATFTSDPPLPEPDIISVLLTGRTLEQSRGAELNIAKEQALSYVSGRAASRLSRAAEKSLGITSVRIEPSLVARDSNPGARLTIGQNITDVLRFVYSMNLVDPADQIQILEYDVTKRFLARGTRQQDNSARFDIEHGFRWGGAPVEAEEKAIPQGSLRIGEIRITGTPALPEEAVRDALGLKPGKRYEFFKAQQKLDRLRNFYRKAGYLEAKVRARRETNAETVDIELEITAGPQVGFSFEGMEPPASLQKRVRRIWEDGFVDSQRIQESLAVLETYLFQKNYLQASVGQDVSQPSPDHKEVTFHIEPGIQYGDVELSFPGAHVIGEAALRNLVKDPERRAKLRDQPDEVTAVLEEYYRQHGYLDASIAKPEFEFDEHSRSARIVVAVEEGPAYHVGEVTFDGNNAFERNQLLSTAFIESGAEYNREWMTTWRSRLEELYWTNGYNEVAIVCALEQGGDATVNLRFRIQEGLQGVVEEVAVEGTHDTASKMARKQVKLQGGDVLNYRKTIESRRNLYQLGAYSLVDVDPQRLTPDEVSGKVPIKMQVRVRERKPFSARYGASYDTERGPGFITDVSMRNKLGAARVLGGRIRYDSEFREARGYVTQPLLFGRHLDTTAAGYRSREIFDTFITDRIGFSINQQTRPWKGNIFSYGYRFERTDTFDKDPDSIFQVPPFNVAPLQFSWNRESRDEYLNATRGSFMSSAFEWAPSHLGSDVQFVKYVGQFFKYFPLSDPVEVPFGGPPRSRWVYAVGVRAGLGKGLGDQNLIRSERFFAGGSTTLRGFEKDGVGPEDFFGPTGGDATFITNNEIRFPIYRWIEGVGFLDMGNIYRRVSDFNPTDLRYSSGFGLRVRTPFVLLRVDYGFILDRKPGEPIGGFYFSIGQAF